MSDSDASASFDERGRAHWERLSNDLRWTVVRYHDLNRDYPRVARSTVYPEWHRGTLTSHLARRSDFWIEDAPGWAHVWFRGSADELLRAREEVWRMFVELCARHGLPLPTPPWERTADSSSPSSAQQRWAHWRDEIAAKIDEYIAAHGRPPTQRTLATLIPIAFSLLRYRLDTVRDKLGVDLRRRLHE